MTVTMLTLLVKRVGKVREVGVGGSDNADLVGEEAFAAHVHEAQHAPQHRPHRQRAAATATAAATDTTTATIPRGGGGAGGDGGWQHEWSEHPGGRGEVIHLMHV